MTTTRPRFSAQLDPKERGCFIFDHDQGLVVASDVGARSAIEGAQLLNRRWSDAPPALVEALIAFRYSSTPSDT